MRVAIYPGSFKPVHNGHLDIIQKALKIFDKVIVARGSNPRKKNYSSKLTLNYENVEVIEYSGLLADYIKNNTNICAIVKGIRNTTDFEYEKIQQYYNEDLGIDKPIIYFIADRNYQHISSSGEKSIMENRKGNPHE